MNEDVFISLKPNGWFHHKTGGLEFLWFFSCFLTLRSSLPCWNYRTSSKFLKRKTPFLRSKLNHVDQSRCSRCVKDTMGSVSQIRFYYLLFSAFHRRTSPNFGQNIFGFNGLFVHPDRLSQKSIPKTLCFFFWRLLLPLLIINGKKNLQNIISTPWRRGEMVVVVERGITETPNQRHLIFRSASRASSTTLGSHLRVAWQRSKNSYKLFAPKV